uniref:Uncharacterized protein n=1 Tax=Arundo donax TaxID=35708 RepID=A0A0A9B8N7_ARUDO
MHISLFEMLSLCFTISFRAIFCGSLTSLLKSEFLTFECHEC